MEQGKKTVWLDKEATEKSWARIYRCSYTGDYLEGEIGFLKFQFKPWHFVEEKRPYYLIPVSLFCTDTCGDVWQRWKIWMSQNKGVYVADQWIRVDSERHYKPYNQEIKIFPDEFSGEINVDISYNICDTEYIQKMFINIEI